MFCEKKHFFNERYSPSWWFHVLEFLVFDGVSLGVMIFVSHELRDFVYFFLDMYTPSRSFLDELSEKSPFSGESYVTRTLIQLDRLKDVLTRISSKWIRDHANVEFMDWCFSQGFVFKGIKRHLVKNGHLELLSKYFLKQLSCPRRTTFLICDAILYNQLVIAEWLMCFGRRSLDFKHIAYTACEHEKYRLVDLMKEKYGFKFQKTFWKEMPKDRIMNKRTMCHVLYGIYLKQLAIPREIYKIAHTSNNVELIRLMNPLRAKFSPPPCRYAKIQ